MHDQLSILLLFYPDWLYILKESSHPPESTENKIMGGAGNKLGGVGSVIVGEVFAGLLYGDPNSYINVAPEWKPSDEAVFAKHVYIPRQ